MLVHGTGTVAEALLIQFSGAGGNMAFEAFVDHFIKNVDPTLLAKTRCRLLPTTFVSSSDTGDTAEEDVMNDDG